MIEVLKASPWRPNVDRVEVTRCNACPRHHVVAVDPTLYVPRIGPGTEADQYVIQALALDGWRMARLPEPRGNALAGWICPTEDAAHGFVIIDNTRDLLRVDVVEARR